MLWIFSWFVVGFIVALVLCAEDLRGKAYDADYFAKSNHNNCGWFATCVVLWYISVIISFCCWMGEKRLFTKFVYKLVNIGVKKDDCKEGLKVDE